MTRALWWNCWSWAFGVMLAILPMTLEAQQLANPLVRPQMKTSNSDEPTEPAERGAVDPRALQQAESRITQEDLNIEQQRLNASVVPKPLALIFEAMQVVAYYDGALVLRTPRSAGGAAASRFGGSAGATDSGGTGGVSGGGGSASVGAVPVLRLRLGQVINLKGYPLRATVDVTGAAVEWRNDEGKWINVFFSSLQSPTGYSIAPPLETLVSEEPDSYQHLLPAASGAGGAASASGGATTSSSLSAGGVR